MSATRDAAKAHEATAQPIFLFQRWRWQIVRIPEGCETDDEGDVVRERAEGSDPDEPREPLSGKELSQITFPDDLGDMPCAIGAWDTERVYLSRQEAEEYGQRRAYNYRDGWRVYCVTASGALADLLEKHGEAAWPAPVPA